MEAQPYIRHSLQGNIRYIISFYSGIVCVFFLACRHLPLPRQGLGRVPANVRMWFFPTYR